ncbi:MAG: tetratricopeptide repeat protein [Steroidobacteraceae bacterium]
MTATLALSAANNAPAAATATPAASSTPPDSATVAPTAISAYTYVHHPVSTDIPAAQFSFDRGLTLFFAYQPDEAEQAFRQAARLDPTLAMAWWGVGLAVGPNINVEPTPEKTVTGADALARAALLAGERATESERDYIAALSTRYTTAAEPDFDALATSYRNSMRTVVQKYPEDADARTLFAEAIMDLHPWRLWKSSGDPEAGTQELVENIEHGLASQPNHPGLLHLYIHAVEASNDPARAFPIAHRLAALPMEPAAAHLVHMPAHIYMRVGDWEAAVAANEHATHQALDYRLSNNPKAQRACGHCADFLSYAYMMQGNQARARQAAENYQKMNDDPSNAIAVLVRFSKWEDVLSFGEPAAESKTDGHDAHALRGFWHFARGLAFVSQRRIDRSQAELEALRAETALAPPGANFEGPPDVRHVLDKITKSIDAYYLKISAAILGSRIAEAQRRMPQAIDLMRTAVNLQDEMPYSEPPPWFYPIRESLGALLLRRGSAAESEAVFREALRRSPNDPRALLGLSAALRAQGRKAEAATQKARFQAAWRFSDGPVVVEDL